MMKKWILLTAACVLMASAIACSDDKPEICDRGTFDSHCDDDGNLVYCNAKNRVETKECSYGCDSNKLICKEKPSSSTNPGGNGGVSRPSNPEQENECGAITEKGKCDGNVAKKCVNNKIQSQTCASGTTCGLRSDGSVDCIAQSSQNPSETPTYTDGAPCGNINADGICDKNTLVYCDNNKLHVETCKLGCILDDFETTAICRRECGNIDNAGVCLENNTRVDFCDPDKGLLTHYCVSPATCQLSQDDKYRYYDCFEGTPSTPSPEKPKYENGAPCGNVTSDGICEGDTLVFCDSDKLLTVEKCDSKCIPAKDNMYAVCHTPCGNVTNVGECVEGGVQYCDERGTLIFDNCAADKMTCQKNNDGFFVCG